MSFRVTGKFDDQSWNGGPHGDYARVYMDVDADLTPLWNWNTKQLFINLVAEYQTDKFEINQISLWDDIIQFKEDAKFTYKKTVNPYAFIDMRKMFKPEQSFNLTMHWNVVPWVGSFRMGRQTAEHGGAVVNHKLPPAEPAFRD